MNAPRFRFTVIPFLLAFVVGFEQQPPTGVVKVDAHGLGIEHEQPWRTRSNGLGRVVPAAGQLCARWRDSLRDLSRHTLFRPAVAAAGFLVAAACYPDVIWGAPVVFGATNSETKHAAEFLLSQANGSLSRESITVLSGENLKAGHVMGRRLVTPTVAAAAALGTNTGNGTVTGQAVGTNLGARRGTYRIVFTEPATNLGTFEVFGPDGIVVGDGVVATEFDNEIKFTINDGATDFVAGDAFTIAVSGGTYKYKEYDVADTDGGHRVAGILYDNVDATSADKSGAAVVRDAEVRKDDLTWFTGATTAQKDAAIDALAALGIIVRS